MKQIIAAIIGETGAGKSTFASMCTDEDIHAHIAGEWGKKGTTKEIKRMLFSSSITTDNGNFESSYMESEDGTIRLPLSSKINLGLFDALLLLDTQGINDWKTDDEKDKVYNQILDVCDEADIIFAMIPEGGSTVSTEEIQKKIFERYCHKPIVLINRTVETEISDLKYVKCDAIKESAKNNLKAYEGVYSQLATEIHNIDLPVDISVDTPLLCLLPSSEELTSNKPKERLKSTNNELRKCINLTLEYAINLQTALINIMSDNFLNSNINEIQIADKELTDINYAIKNLKEIAGIPRVTPMKMPYVKHKDWAKETEYSWQGGTAASYGVCGGDYTYIANSIYQLINNMISNLNISVGIKSSLFSILYGYVDDVYTPGTLNLGIKSYTRGVPVDSIISVRTNLYTKYPNLFRDINSKDFDNPKQEESWWGTPNTFRNLHGDWDKLLERFYFYEPSIQETIKEGFEGREWSATVFISLVMEVLKNINFSKMTEEELKKNFLNSAFDENGGCKLWK